MRRTVLLTVMPVLLAVAALLSVSAVSSADDGRPIDADLRRRVQPAGAHRHQQRERPQQPLAFGDANVFYDRLSVEGEHAGDEVGSCVIAVLTPEIVANCGMVVRLPDGDITGSGR